MKIEHRYPFIPGFQPLAPVEETLEDVLRYPWELAKHIYMGLQPIEALPATIRPSVIDRNLALPKTTREQVLQKVFT